MVALPSLTLHPFLVLCTLGNLLGAFILVNFSLHQFTSKSLFLALALQQVLMIHYFQLELPSRLKFTFCFIMNLNRRQSGFLSCSFFSWVMMLFW